MSDFVTVDTQQVDKVLATLSNQQIVNEILNEGIEEMAIVYYQSVLSSLRREMGSAADTTGSSKGWHTFNYPLSTGIDIHPDKANITWGVHGLKDPRLLWFEGGSQPRYTKSNKITGYVTNKRTGKVNYKRLARTGKGGYRGVLPANHFFTKGISEKEQQALQTLQETIIQAIRNKGIDITQ